MRAVRCRRVPCLGVALLIIILLATHVERRVAEADFNDDYYYAWTNADTVDGEEILSRLILLNDTVLPEAPRDAGPLVALVSVDKPDVVDALELSTPGSRAPPAPSL